MGFPSEPKFVTVARILRARGNKGEVAAELWTDFPERLPEIKELFLRAESGTRRAVALRSIWVDRNHPGKGVFHFDCVDCINDAEKLRGRELQCAADRSTLPGRPARLVGPGFIHAKLEDFSDSTKNGNFYSDCAVYRWFVAADTAASRASPVVYSRPAEAMAGNSQRRAANCGGRD